MARVLILDNVWFRAIDLADFLASHGHLIFRTASHGDLMSVAKVECPDVAVLDPQAPGGAYDVLIAAQIQACCSCALVFVTGCRDAEMIGQMRRLQPAALVGKPASGDMILTAVERMAREN